MFEKTKEFVKNHKGAILAITGATLVITVGVLAGRKPVKPIAETIANSLVPDKDFLEFLAEKGLDVTVKEGYGIPFMNKDVAHKALDVLGDSFQIDNFDADTWAIWITK